MQDLVEELQDITDSFYLGEEDQVEAQKPNSEKWLMEDCTYCGNVFCVSLSYSHKTNNIAKFCTACGHQEEG